MHKMLEDALQHVREKSETIEHGEIAIIFKGNDKNLDVIVKDRTRFEELPKRNGKVRND